MIKNISIRIPKSESNQVFITAVRLLKQNIERRSTALVFDAAEDFELILNIKHGIGQEGFRISRESDRSILITGNDEAGLLYGIGKFLRSSGYGQDGFEPSEWSGISIPEKEIRGIYLATHFHNFYHDAPIEKVKQYIDDLVLYGINTLCVWFDMHHYKGIDDRNAVAMISRIRDIINYAKQMHLKICLTMIGNESFDSSPQEMRAQYTAGHDGYTRQLAGHYHIELCPAKPGALEQLLQWRKEVLQNFLDIQLDYICIWPYDQGGCTCSECKPWGANGFLKVAEPVAELAKSMFSDVKIILSTWLFDSFTTGEWVGLSEAFKDKPSWVDYLLAEFLDGRLPETVSKNGIPGLLPCIGFPEISMYGATPWGGFGANPTPVHIQSLWKVAGQLLSGGFPYSEGIFDDINKFLYARLYWGDSGSLQDFVKEYAEYEFGDLCTEDILSAIFIFESTIGRNRLDKEGRNHNYPDDKIPWKGEQRFVIDNTQGIDEAFKIVSKVDGKLPSWAKNSWRWRILYLRGLIDRELFYNGFRSNENLEKAYSELTEIYHAQNADYCVAPPTLEAITLNRGGFSWS